MSGHNPACHEEDALVKQILFEHFLSSIICDPIAKTDTANCACSMVQLPTMPSIGEAVKTWVDHVAEQLTPAITTLRPERDEALEAVINNKLVNEMAATIEDLESHQKRIEAERDAAVEALRPFAEEAAQYDPIKKPGQYLGDDRAADDSIFSVGDLRRAASLASRKEEV